MYMPKSAVPLNQSPAAQPQTGYMPKTAIPVQPEKKSLGGFMSNLGTSAVKAVTDVGQAIAHPVQTGKALYGLGSGVVSKFIPGRQESEQNVDNLVSSYKDKYKGGLLNTLYNDPIGVALDASTVLGGAGAALRGVGTVGKVAGLTKAGSTLSKVGTAIDPLMATGKAVGTVTKPLFSKIKPAMFAKSEKMLTAGLGNPARQSRIADKAGRSVASFIDEYKLYDRTPSTAREVTKQIGSQFDEAAMGSKAKIPVQRIVDSIDAKIAELKSGTGGVISDNTASQIEELTRRKNMFIESVMPKEPSILKPLDTPKLSVEPTGGKYLYHGTNETVLENISKEGLKPGMSTGNISLSPNESYAKQWSQSGMTPQGKTEGIMLRVNKDLLKTKILPSKSGVKGDQLNELISKDVIPPQAIEINRNGKWEPLSVEPVGGKDLSYQGTGKGSIRRPTNYGFDASGVSDKSIAESGGNITDNVKNILKKIKGNPEAEVTIYRGAPKGAGINEGDWIALDRSVAEEFTRTRFGKPLPGYEVQELKVKAKDILPQKSAGKDKIYDFSYSPSPLGGKVGGDPLATDINNFMEANTPKIKPKPDVLPEMQAEMSRQLNLQQRVITPGEATTFRRKVIDPDVPKSEFGLNPKDTGKAGGVKATRDIFRQEIINAVPELKKLGLDYGMAKEVEKIITDAASRASNRQLFNFTKLGSAGVGAFLGGIPGLVGGFVTEQLVNSPKFIEITSKMLRSMAESKGISPLFSKAGKSAYLFGKAGRMATAGQTETPKSTKEEILRPSPVTSPSIIQPSATPYQVPKIRRPR